MSATELSCDDSEPPSRNFELFFNIADDVNSTSVPSAQTLSDWALHAVKGVPSYDANVVYEVSLSVVTAPAIQALNCDYRNKNTPTNVLSFPSDMPLMPATDNSAMHRALGDIVLCASVIEAEATQQSKQLNHHWAHMVVHSVLHLFEYDHELDDEANAMEALEVTLLQGLSISNPYSNVASNS